MKARLKAGEIIDVLSGREYDSGVDRITSNLQQLRDRDFFQVALSIPAGTGTTTLYQCPLGTTAQMHRISFAAPGYSASSPLTAGDVELYLGVDLIQFLPVSGIVAPVVMTEGSGGIVMHGGEQLNAQTVNTPVALSVFIQFRRWGLR